ANLAVNLEKPINQDKLFKLAEAIQIESPSSRIIIRLSGTEPLLRILVEDQCQLKTNRLLQTLIQQLQPLLYTTP
ncbi:MAG TPA: hypothetical protein VHA52_08065, partial [Candidatus Babeliaceae bacterium]|nr:hypothetical protein [Candidatus Babeliaceae bacterium]